MLDSEADGTETDDSVSAGPDAEVLVDTLNASFGGAHRTAHSIGIGLTGTFTPSLSASRFCSAKVFEPESDTMVTARFSNGPGGWVNDDRPPDVRGLAVKFDLDPDLDMIAVSMDAFFVKTPEEFVEFLQHTMPEPGTGVPDAEAFATWLGTHPNAFRVYQQLTSLGYDQSYASLAYNSLHAYEYSNSDGVTTTARFSWVPDIELARLDRNTDVSGWEPDYLRRDIVARVRRGDPAIFRLVAQVQGPGDPSDDSSTVWKSKDLRELGQLRLGALVADQYWGCEALRFNPCRVIDGIRPSDDPVLISRGSAYKNSAQRRTVSYPPPSRLPPS